VNTWGERKRAFDTKGFHRRKSVITIIPGIARGGTCSACGPVA
jgi:hypothetical protein